MGENLSSKGHFGPSRGGPLEMGLLPVVVLGIVALLASACSSSPSTAASSGSGSPTRPQSATSVTLRVGNAGSLGKVLTGPNGHTLYLLTTEKNGSIGCTGSCAQIWPPLLVTGSAKPSAGSGAMGSVGTVSRPGGGTQVTYEGHPLYYYASDSASGQANGQGIEGIWFAVAPDGSAAQSPGISPSGTSPVGRTPTTTSTTTSGYGY